MIILDALKNILHLHSKGSAPEGKSSEAGQTTGRASGGQAEPEDRKADSPSIGNSWDDAVEYIQIGFSEFTTEKGVLGFYLDPENRWLKLAKEVNEIAYRHRAARREYEAAAGANAGDCAAGADSACQAPGETAAGNQEAACSPAPENAGTLVLDASCGPVRIRYPQDFSILNECRLDLEAILNRLCHDYNFTKPRTYVRTIQEEAKNLSKSKNKTEKALQYATCYA